MCAGEINAKYVATQLADRPGGIPEWSSLKYLIYDVL